VKPSLLVHALRTAQPRQLRARALRPLRRRQLGAGTPPPFAPLDAPVPLWRSPAFQSQALAGAGSERLRGFHAHYGEEVLTAAREGDEVSAQRLLSEWIERNPARPSDAWHPYTTSTRAGNWIAALSLLPELETQPVRESLWRQLVVLGRNVEDDVLGNHVIRNARALVLGGAAFGAAAMLEQGVRLLERELPVQVLPDGGHYERSPVYHLVVLGDLLEVRAAVDVPGLGGAIERMRGFAAGLARPDGAPALFNDGGLDLAPSLDLPVADDGLSIYADTGYAILRTPRVWLAFDCGPPSPPYLPAHAHADALSFQLWVDGSPVVVDPGTFTYEPGAQRDWFRGTRAHSTVAIDGDQFELWGAFRSGPLPRVELLEASEQELAAATTGRTGVRHERRIRLDAGELTIVDRLEGGGSRLIESSLPLAPGIEPGVSALGSRPARREPRPLSERLFERVEADALVVREERTLPAELGWTITIR